MSIVKTSPPPQMTVGDYRSAALRHFITCKVLWRYVNLPASNFKNLPEDEVLKNIFYLIGYVAECAIKYRYLTNCCGQMDDRTETQWTSAGHDVKNHFEFVKSRNRVWSENIVQQLDTLTTVHLPDYLKILGNSSATIVPPLTPAEETYKVMQASWEPTIRYHYATNGLAIPPNKSEIEAFYLATKTLLHNLAIL